MEKAEIKMYNGFSQIDKDEEVLHYLQLIEKRMESEIAAKQKTIERQESELLQLRKELADQKKLLQIRERETMEAQHQTEGNRQLVNKLLNDIDRMQQDIAWYKRTYESRSLLGVLRDRIKYYSSKSR
ncbi:MAG TPA: hypothetical protein VIQ00_05485 [Chitinophagaceae bacterium]|jgi:hypothetical protein